jgi:hypothetical protein
MSALLVALKAALLIEGACGRGVRQPKRPTRAQAGRIGSLVTRRRRATQARPGLESLPGPEGDAGRAEGPLAAHFVE